MSGCKIADGYGTMLVISHYPLSSKKFLEYLEISMAMIAQERILNLVSECAMWFG